MENGRSDPQMADPETMASAAGEPIMGVWGHSPQRGPVAKPLVGGQGVKPPPPEVERFFGFWKST